MTTIEGADADRSMARMWPATSRAATARDAAPGPHPISMTRECGCRGSASTIAPRRGDRRAGTGGTIAARFDLAHLRADPHHESARAHGPPAYQGERPLRR